MRFRDTTRLALAAAIGLAMAAPAFAQQQAPNALARAERNVDQAIEAIQAAQPGEQGGHRVRALELLRQAKQALNEAQRTAR